MKNTKKITITSIIIVMIIALLFIFKESSTKIAKCVVNTIRNRDVLYSVYYENNIPHNSLSEVDIDKNDVREVQVTKTRKNLVNHSRGFSLSFPLDAEFDFTAAQEYILVKCKDMSAVISKEFSTYSEKEKTKQFVDDYLHKYILAPKYIEQNKITLHKNEVEKIGDFWVQIVALSRTPLPDSPIKYNSYVYCYIYTNSTMFYRIMFKAPEYTEGLMEEIYKTLYSFSTDVQVRGPSDTYTDFKPIIPEFWSDETKDFYNKLVNSDTCKWGLYQPLSVANNNFSDIYKVENEIDAKFDGLLEYCYYFEDIPVEGIKKAYNEGRIVQLTLQTSTVMNMNLDGHNPVFDIIDGMYDERFKIMAGQIKEIGRPILFRLNNEMNSDWTSYGSSACLDDPEIYVELWRKIYNIFKEEGVDNAIWVFNPNDESYPPCGYNSTIAFYPGNEYVQIFGVTGYNTGTYYAVENGEKWKTFKEIYDNIMEKQYKIYGKFPWIITEFASSSVGGDKVQWINDMFKDLKNYPNIKMAFWFNSADIDPRDKTMQAIARPYWLNESRETAKAFSDGIKNK